eukprot:364595-Chlamydomonas_euryale.AAC.14
MAPVQDDACCAVLRGVRVRILTAPDDNGRAATCRERCSVMGAFVVDDDASNGRKREAAGMEYTNVVVSESACGAAYMAVAAAAPPPPPPLPPLPPSGVKRPKAMGCMCADASLTVTASRLPFRHLHDVRLLPLTGWTSVFTMGRR